MNEIIEQLLFRWIPLIKRLNDWQKFYKILISMSPQVATKANDYYLDDCFSRVNESIERIIWKKKFGITLRNTLNKNILLPMRYHSLTFRRPHAQQPESGYQIMLSKDDATAYFVCTPKSEFWENSEAWFAFSHSCETLIFLLTFILAFIFVVSKFSFSCSVLKKSTVSNQFCYRIAIKVYRQKNEVIATK